MTVSSLKSVGSLGRRNYRSIRVRSKRSISLPPCLTLPSLRRSPMRAIFKANFLLIEQLSIEFAAVAQRPTGTRKYPLENENN
jgi:hypothetical protein